MSARQIAGDMPETFVEAEWVLQVTKDHEALHRLAPAVANMIAFASFRDGWSCVCPSVGAIAEAIGADGAEVRDAISSLSERGHVRAEIHGEREHITLTMVCPTLDKGGRA
jgi:hypothetical protein